MLSMTTWFTSDLHVSHAKIVDYCDRPFRDDGGNPDVAYMTEVLVKNWNDRVAPDDVVFCLGDMVMGRREETLPTLARLNGDKRLIMGNHDYCWPHLWKRTQIEKATRWTNAYAPYFTEMATSGGYTLADGTFVLLNHFPYVGDSGEEDRYTEHRPIDQGEILLHGHVHDTWKTQKTANGTLMVNVGVDVHNYKPISEDEIIQLLREEG